jgi:hypothetical protein
MPGPKSRKPLRFRSRSAARPFGGKNGRGEIRGERPRLRFFGRESPKGREAQESTRPRPGVNIQGSRRGHGFLGGIKPPELHRQAGKVWRERAGAEGEEGKPSSRSPGRMKALKGEAHGRRELKEASMDRGALTPPGG